MTNKLQVPTLAIDPETFVEIELDEEKVKEVSLSEDTESVPSTPVTQYDINSLTDEDIQAMSLEELRELNSQIDPSYTPASPERLIRSDEEIATMSLEELREYDRQLEEEVEKPRAITTGPSLEFIDPEHWADAESIQDQVTGRSRVLQAIDQFFKPYKTKSTIKKIGDLATRTEEESAAIEEEQFQHELNTRTAVGDLRQQIEIIEDNAKFEGRDLTDEDWDQMLAIQDEINELEAINRDAFQTAGTLINDPSISVKEVASAIIEDPIAVTKVLANEVVTNPIENFIIPGSSVKLAKKAVDAVSAVSTSKAAIAGANIVGASSSAAVLAGGTALATDMVDQYHDKATNDVRQNVEQAKIGGYIGLALGTIIGAAATPKSISRINNETDALLDLSRVDEVASTMNQKTYGLGSKYFEDFEPDYTKELVYDTQGNSYLLKSEDFEEKAIRKNTYDMIVERSQEELIQESNAILQNKLSRGTKKQLRAVVHHLEYERDQLRNKINGMKNTLILDEANIVDMTDVQAVNQSGKTTKRLTASQFDRKRRAMEGNIRLLEDDITGMDLAIDRVNRAFAEDKEASVELARIQKAHGKVIDDQVLQKRIESAMKDNEISPDDIDTSRTVNVEEVPVLEKGHSKPVNLTKLDPEKSLADQGINLEDAVAPRRFNPNMFQPTHQDTVWLSLINSPIGMGQAVSRIDTIVDVSPTAHKMRNIFRHDGKTKVGELSHTERVMENTGKYIMELNDSLNPIKKKLFNRLDKEKEEAVIHVLRGGKSHPLRHKSDVQEAATAVRGMLDNMLDYARKAGHKVGEIKDYFPRVYNVSYLKTSEGAARFRNVLAKYKDSDGMTDARITEILTKIISDDGVFQINPNTFNAEGISSTNVPLGTRSLDFLDDAEIAPFLSKELNSTLETYITSVVRSVESTRSFGWGGEKLHKMLSDITEEIKQVKKADGTMDTLHNKTKQQIIDLANALQGNYNRFNSKRDEAVMGGLTVYGQVATMPLVTITSLVEPFIGLSRTRPTSWANGLHKAVKAQGSRTLDAIFSDYTPDEIVRQTHELGVVTNAALSEHLGNLFGGEITGQKKLNKLSATFFRTNFLHSWTQFVRTWMFEAAKADITKSAALLNNPDLPQWRRDAILTDIEKLGMDPKKLDDWITKGADVTDPNYREVLNGSVRLTNETMVHPDATNRPIFFSSPKYAIFNMLLSYPTVFSNTVMKNWLKGFNEGNAYYKGQHLAKSLAAATAMFVMADFGAQMKERIQWGEEGNPYTKNMTTEEWFLDRANRAGLFSPVQHIYNGIEAEKYGKDPSVVRFGPVFGTMMDTVKGASSVIHEGDWDPLKKTASKAIPIANVTAQSKDYIYRNILGGGKLYEEAKYEEAKYENLPEPNREVITLWDSLFTDNIDSVDSESSSRLKKENVTRTFERQPDGSIKQVRTPKPPVKYPDFSELNPAEQNIIRSMTAMDQFIQSQRELQNEPITQEIDLNPETGEATWR